MSRTGMSEEQAKLLRGKEQARLLRGMAPALALGLLILPGAALANGPYIGVSGGFGIPRASAGLGEVTAAIPAAGDFAAIPAGTEIGLRTEYNPGWAASGQLGYDFGNGFRVEAEGAFSRYNVDRHVGLTVNAANIDALDMAVLTRTAPAPGNPNVGEILADGQGRVHNFGAFANVFYDLRAGPAFRPFLGAGVGYQWVDADFLPSGLQFGSGIDGGIAYQLMAGATYQLSPTLDFYGQYTYRELTGRARIDLDLLPAELGVQSLQSLLTVGLRFRFYN